jgi:hypothetical protein
VHERLTRIESLLESVTQHSKLRPVIRGRSQAETIDSLERSLGVDAMTPESSDSEKLENVPVMSLFDNGVVSSLFSAGIHQAWPTKNMN